MCLIDNDVSDLKPAFQGQDLKQCQQRIPEVIKVKVPWICPNYGVAEVEIEERDNQKKPSMKVQQKNNLK